MRAGCATIVEKNRQLHYLLKVGLNTKATVMSWLLFLRIYTFAIRSKDSLRGMTVCERVY